jgi:hypothetical protein
MFLFGSAMLNVIFVCQDEGMRGLPNWMSYNWGRVLSVIIVIAYEEYVLRILQVRV